jgi:hypothetical protein
MLIYDTEIIRAIPDRKAPNLDGIEYCAGWHDHANMGVSVIGAYDYGADRYRIFLKDNFAEFVALAAASRPLIGFNSLSFDDRLCAACGITTTPTDYDLLVEMWGAAGLGATFNYPTHAGFGLDATAKENLGNGKTGDGARAAILWQRGEFGKVIDYCLEDVRLTKRLIDRVLRDGGLRDPRGSGRLVLRRP